MLISFADFHGPPWLSAHLLDKFYISTFTSLCKFKIPHDMLTSELLFEFSCHDTLFSNLFQNIAWFQPSFFYLFCILFKIYHAISLATFSGVCYFTWILFSRDKCLYTPCGLGIFPDIPYGLFFTKLVHVFF